jgi:hypothetical protein
MCIEHKESAVGTVSGPEATDWDAETPENRTESRDRREYSELGSKDEESSTLQKVADGDMGLGVKNRRSNVAVQNDP